MWALSGRLRSPVTLGCAFCYRGPIGFFSTWLVSTSASLDTGILLVVCTADLSYQIKWVASKEAFVSHPRAIRLCVSHCNWMLVISLEWWPLRSSCVTDRSGETLISCVMLHSDFLNGDNTVNVDQIGADDTRISVSARHRNKQRIAAVFIQTVTLASVLGLGGNAKDRSTCFTKSCSAG